MNTASYELIAASHAVNALAAFIGGLIIAGALIWAVRMGIKVRRQEPRPPTVDEQPRLPAHGAVHEVREMRDADEVPHAADESERLMPYQLHTSGSKHAEDQHRRRWVHGGGTGTGSDGEPGAT
jgi:uncharacterized iron-regulated membrane protein